MFKKFSLFLIFALLVAGCGAEAVEPASLAEEPSVNPPTKTVTEAPLRTPTQEPTAVLLVPTTSPPPTETGIDKPAEDPNIFGSVSLEDAPQGFLLEPVAQVIFEFEMQKLIDAGQIGALQIEGLSIVPRGDGTFFAEIFYAVQADASFWPEDFGTPADDGWVRGKCTRLDFEITADGYYLKNKAICN